MGQNGILRAGDLALTQSHWGLKGTDPSGAPVVLDHYGVEIMQLQKNGTWRFPIDDPFAGDDVVVRDEASTSASGSDSPAAIHQRMARLFNEGKRHAASTASGYGTERLRSRAIITSASIERYLTWLGEPTEPPTLAPPFFKSVVIRRKLGEPAQAELFDAH